MFSVNCARMERPLNAACQWHLPLRPSPNETSIIKERSQNSLCSTELHPSCLLFLMWRLMSSCLPLRHDCNLNHSANTRYIHRNWYHLAQLIASCHRSRLFRRSLSLLYKHPWLSPAQYCAIHSFQQEVNIKRWSPLKMRLLLGQSKKAPITLRSFSHVYCSAQMSSVKFQTRWSGHFTFDVWPYVGEVMQRPVA